MEPAEHRYPFELVDVWQTRGDERVLIRPVHPQDAELARAFVRGMSPPSRYNRFHQPLAELTPAMARWATHVDYDRHFALIAEVFGDDGEVEIGVARYVVTDRDECAEVALAVADAWQRQGVGERLLRGLIEVAARRGLRWLEGEVLATNEPMLALARKLGFQMRRQPRGALTVTIDRQVETADQERLAPSSVPRWFTLLQGFTRG
jgi:acetyltransferase